MLNVWEMACIGAIVAGGLVALITSRNDARKAEERARAIGTAEELRQQRANLQRAEWQWSQAERINLRRMAEQAGITASFADKAQTMAALQSAGYLSASLLHATDGLTGFRTAFLDTRPGPVSRKAGDLVLRYGPSWATQCKYAN